MTGGWGLALGVYAALVIATAAAVLRVDAPYGRHARAGWGPTVSARAGWILMELPSLLAALWALRGVDPAAEPVVVVLVAPFVVHYVHRALVHPFLQRSGRPMPLVVAGMGAAFTAFNATACVGWLVARGPRDPSWLLDPRFLFGAALTAAGFATHLKADAMLRALRAPGETGYKVPRGFLFRFVTCPNYLGEIAQWTGWALMTWSPFGALFALYSLANLGPRARAHHRWYHATFPDYPRERSALVPFLGRRA